MTATGSEVLDETGRPGTARAAAPAAGQNCFDFLRLFAALAVVVQHAAEHLGATFLWYSSGSGQWFLDGVPLFFILSGLLVYRSAERCAEQGRPWRDFYRNRLLRVAPAIYVYTALATLVLLLTGSLALREAMSGQFAGFLAGHLLLAPVYHPAVLRDVGVGVLNGSLWTIPVEVGFYVVVPIIVLAARRFGFARAAAGSVLLAAAGVALHATAGGSSAETLLGKVYDVTFLAWLWYFTLGIAWTRLWGRVPHSGWLALVCVLVYAGAAAVRETHGPSGSTLVTAVAAVPLSYAVLWVGYYGPAALRSITERAGDLSFGVYIWHMPLINVLVELGVDGRRGYGSLLVLGVIAASLLVAFASWRFVERPALRRKRYSVSEDRPLVPSPRRSNR